MKYIYRWEKGEKNQSWSGTPYHLRDALKRYTFVEDIDVQNNLWNRISLKLTSLGEDITGQCNFGEKAIEIEERKIPKKNIGNNPCIVFEEYITNSTQYMYHYLDCSIGYISRFKDSNESHYLPFSGKNKNKNFETRKKRSKLFHKKCAGILTMSKWLRDDLVNNSHVDPQKVHWVGGGCNIDASRIDYSLKNGKKFLFVGRDWKRKNGPLVVQAFLNLLNNYGDIDLYVAGPEKCPFEDHEHIHFLGDCGYDKLVKYYNLCDYFVMPSNFEAYGIVFAEALIFGLPCIGADRNTMPEFICPDENGYLIKENSVDELRDSMELLLVNHDRLFNNVIRKRKFYEEYYSWDSVAKRIISVMSEDGFRI
jgi:glycosyltransferase involved in cell wall biosynthesis